MHIRQTHPHMHTYAYTDVYTYTCTNTCNSIHARAHTRTHMHMHTYTFTYTHAQIHIHKCNFDFVFSFSCTGRPTACESAVNAYYKCLPFILAVASWKGPLSATRQTFPGPTPPRSARSLHGIAPPQWTMLAYAHLLNSSLDP